MRALKVFGILAVLCFGACAAEAQEVWYTDWTEYYYNAGVDAHFYYSPRSVYRVDDLRQVEWTDSKSKGAEAIVFIVHINCRARTIQSRTAKRFDASSHAYLGAVDLTAKAPVETVTPGSMADRLINAVC